MDNGSKEYLKLGLTLLDFNNNVVDVSYYRKSHKYLLDFGGSFINNKQGEVILQTNNCEIRDTNWHVISGDELITPTRTAANTCTDGGNEYGAEQTNKEISKLTSSLKSDNHYFVLIPVAHHFITFTLHAVLCTNAR